MSRRPLVLHLFRRLVGEDLDLRLAAVAGLQFDEPVVETALAELLAQTLAFAAAVVIGRHGQRLAGVFNALLPRDERWLQRCFGNRGWGCTRLHQQHLEQAILGGEFGAVLDLLELLLAHHVDAHLDEIAHDGLDVAADVADLGELRGLDLEEGRVGQLRETSRNLRLAHAGRADHEDVLRHDLLGELGPELLAARAIAQRDGDRALGGRLPDDVFVELGDGLARCQLFKRERLVFCGAGEIDSHRCLAVLSVRLR